MLQANLFVNAGQGQCVWQEMKTADANLQNVAQNILDTHLLT